MSMKTFAVEYRSLIRRHDDDKPALIVGNEIVTFGAFRERIATCRQGLAAIGVGPGSRVAVCFPNSPEILYLAFAVCDSGACLVPIHPATPIPFMARVSAFLGVDRMIVPPDSGLRETSRLPCDVVPIDALPMTAAGGNAPAPATPNPDDTAVIISTSGTTAQPKFVPISQQNFATIIDSTRAMIEPVDELARGCSYIVVFPLSSSGILPTMAQVALGGTYVLTDDVSLDNFLSLIERHRLDGIQCPPAYLESLAQYPRIYRYDVSSVTRLNSGSDFVPNKLLLALKKRFKNLTHVGIGYGLAETSAIMMCWNAHTEAELRVPTNRFRIINPEENEVTIFGNTGPLPPGERGEIRLRGKSVIKGYFENPELTRQAFDDDGRLHTGDSGLLESDGTLRLLGRNRDTIKRGGRSVSPVVVSAALEEHPEVASAAVVGVPHTLFGEMIWAFVKPTPESTVTEGNLNAFLRETLPPYLKPDNIVFMDAIPRTKGVGKIDYEELRRIGIEKLSEMTGEPNE